MLTGFTDGKYNGHPRYFNDFEDKMKQLFGKAHLSFLLDGEKSIPE
jgi:hypothetical protein